MIVSLKNLWLKALRICLSSAQKMIRIIFLKHLSKHRFEYKGLYQFPKNALIIKIVNAMTNEFISVRTVYHPVRMNCFAVIQTGRVRRQAGDVEVRNFTVCTDKNPMGQVANCMNVPNYNLSCRMTAGNCYYWVTCEKINVRLSWSCKQVHLRYSVPACCDFVCP